MANSSCYILNYDLDIVAIIDEYLEAEWHRSLSEIGSFRIIIDRSQYNHNVIRKGYFVLPPNPSNNTGVDITYPYRIEQIELMFDATGRESEAVIISGRSIGGVLEDRLCLPDPGMDYHTMKGSVEMIMKHYVDKNCGPNALDPARRLPNFEIAPNQNRGPIIYYRARYQTLFEIFREFYNLTGYGWEITFDPSRKKFIFDVVKGEDRREDTSNPIYFDVNFETALAQHWITTDLDRKNVAYVADSKPEEETEYHSCTCHKTIKRWYTEAMENVSADFFAIDNEKYDFELGTLTNVYAHDAGHLELAVRNAALSKIEDTQAHFSQGTLDDVVATAAGGLELKTSTYVQTYDFIDDFESNNRTSGITFRSQFTDGRAYTRVTNPKNEPYKGKSGRSYMRATIPSGFSYAEDGPGFIIGIPEHPSDSFNRKVSFWVKKTAGYRSFQPNILYHYNPGSSEYDKAVYDVYNENGKPVLFEFGIGETPWYQVVIDLDTTAPGNFTSAEFGVYFDYEGFNPEKPEGEWIVDDIQFHYERTITGYPSDGVGTRVSPPIALTNLPGQAKSRIEWDATIPAGTEIVIETAVTNDGVNKPQDWQYTRVAQSGSPIPGVEGQEVNGKYLWVRQTLKSDSPYKTPTIHKLAVYLNQTYYPNGNRISSLNLTSIGINLNNIIEWVADEPQGTSVVIETRLNGGAWMKATNGEKIPGLVDGQNLNGVILDIRATLHSDNPEVTPRLLELGVYFNKNTIPEPTGFDRREMFVEARGLKTITAKSLRGDAKLRETRTPDTIETVVNPNGAFRYKDHWDIGDIVTVMNAEWGIRTDVRIVGVKYTSNEEGYDLKVELGNPFPTIKSNVKREIERSTQLLP